MRILIPLLFVTTLAGCSAYESDGRKYLEKSAYDLAGLKLHERLIGCAAMTSFTPGDAPWLPTEVTDPLAQTFERERGHVFELRVAPQSGAPACDYAFVTAAERAEARDLAIAATLNGVR